MLIWYEITTAAGQSPALELEAGPPHLNHNWSERMNLQLERDRAERAAVVEDLGLCDCDDATADASANRSSGRGGGAEDVPGCLHCMRLAITEGALGNDEIEAVRRKSALDQVKRACCAGRIGR